MPSKRFDVRLSDDLHAMLENEQARTGLSQSAIFRDALMLYFYGSDGIERDKEAGFREAVRQTHRMVRAALSVAMDMIPDNYEDAKAWSEGEIRRRQELARSKKGSDTGDI